MPKRVEWDLRKHDVLEVVWDIIETRGIEGVTLRTVAQESGWSAGSIAHYFADKEDIMTSALRLSHEEIRDRRAGNLASATPTEALRVFMLDNLPLDERRRRETLLEVAYWARCIADPKVREIQTGESSRLRESLVEILDDGIERGEFRLNPDTTNDVAERLLGLIDGLSLHVVLYPTRLSASQAQRIVEKEIEDLLSPQPDDERIPA